MMAESNARARAGRRAARSLFGIGLAVPAVAALLFVSAPSFIDPMYSDGSIQLVAPLIALLGVGVGLTCMWRILRADPEPDSSAWRYRDF